MTTSQEFDLMLSEVDSTFGVTVTYTAMTPGSFDATTMSRPQTGASSSVTAVRGPSSTTYENGFKEEQVTYSIRTTAIAERPQAGGTVRDGTITRTVVQVTLSVDEKCYEVVTRRKL